MPGRSLRAACCRRGRRSRADGYELALLRLVPPMPRLELFVPILITLPGEVRPTARAKQPPMPAAGRDPPADDEINCDSQPHSIQRPILRWSNITTRRCMQTSYAACMLYFFI